MVYGLYVTTYNEYEYWGKPERARASPTLVDNYWAEPE